MISRKYLILLIIISLTLSYANDVLKFNNIKKRVGNISAKYQSSIGKDSLQEDLENPIKFTIDNKGNCFVFDASSFEIKKYDLKNKFITKFCRRGNGPGEITYPGDIFVLDSNIAIVDNRSKKIVLFSPDGSFLQNTHFYENGTLSSLKVQNNTYFALYSSYKFNDNDKIDFTYEINSYDRKLQKIKTYLTRKVNFSKTESFNPLESIPYFALIDNKLYIDDSDENFYRIKIFDYKASSHEKIIKRKYRKIRYKERENEEIKKWLKTRKVRLGKKRSPYSRAIAGVYSHNEYLFVLLNNFIDAKNCLNFDIYKDDILLGKFSLNVSSSGKYISSENIKFHQNHIYLLNEEKLCIDIYELIIKD